MGGMERCMCKREREIKREERGGERDRERQRYGK